MIVSRHIPGGIKKARNIVMAFLLPIYLGLPWLRWPFGSEQLSSMSGSPFIQLNIPARKFFLAGHIFIPEEGIYLFLFLLIAGLSLFFFTSLFGRIWCGWTCPQTVFTEVFDSIGRRVLGSKYGKKDANKALVILLHLIWIAISIFAAFSWIAYFTDPYKMIDGFIHPASLADESWPYFMAFFTATLYLDMAFVREQFCKYACPYARFQTVMMDNHSVNVTYDFQRGEPRRNKLEKIGDCTACNLCLVVCPTGIDIREGVQISCIACGKCIDACTKQMAKENKVSLIRYMSQSQAENKNTKVKWIRPRTIVYAVIFVTLATTAVYLLNTRVPMQIGLLPDRNIAPMMVTPGVVRNFYNLSIQNISLQDRNFHILIGKNDFSSAMKLRLGEENDTLYLSASSRKEIRIILETSSLSKNDLAKMNHSVEIIIQDDKDPKFNKLKVTPFIIPAGSI